MLACSGTVSLRLWIRLCLVATYDTWAIFCLFIRDVVDEVLFSGLNSCWNLFDEDERHFS